MATQTDRIVSYLPPTFRALPRPTTLYTVVDAFGTQLLQAENSLGAVMLSHWVDFADRGAEFIADLGCFAALYGLAPRGAAKDVARFQMPTCVPVSADETVEQFREHLKRYVLTFLQGTVTVQGILRIVAEALGLHIQDDYAGMDTWWTRDRDPFVSIERRPDDAAELLFGIAPTIIPGAVAKAAQIAPPWGLADPLDLRFGSVLRLSVDGSAPVDIDLAPESYQVALDDVVATINRKMSLPVASASRHQLTLASPTVGAASRLEVQDVPDDAAQFLLGLSPRVLQGTPASAATLIGYSNLEGSLNLADNRYLRLHVDNAHLAEVDCAGEPPTPKTLLEIVAAINHAFGFELAAAEKNALRLSSPSTGPHSSIVVLRSAAQDASRFLLRVNFDDAFFGSEAKPASIFSSLDWLDGESMDLSRGSRIRLAIDGGPPVTISCAGANPSHTFGDEIVNAINNALGMQIAQLYVNPEPFTVGLLLTSPTVGPSSEIRFFPLAEDEGVKTIFGISPRAFDGADAVTARLIGETDLSAGVDLRARRLLQVSLDGEPPVGLDLWNASNNLNAVTLAELEVALNAAFGAEVASDDGRHLILESRTSGPSGSVALLPAEETWTRRFVSRAYITDEASTAIFGFLSKTATGTPATPALLRGSVDLSQGVDLRQNRYLLIKVDALEAKQVDCAAAARIPRRANLDEIVSSIDTRIGAEIASHDGRHLDLQSQTTGESAFLSVEDPQAAWIIMWIQPGRSAGSDGTGIFFEGAVDLSHGVDLSKVDRIKIGLNDAAPVEIICAGPNPAHTTLDEIIARINLTLKVSVASHDRGHIVLAVQPGDSESKLEFASPGSRDATAAILGFTPARSYKGEAPSKAVMVGKRDLSGGLDLSMAHFMRISVDDRQAIDVDCAKDSADPSHARIEEIVKAINTALGAPIASGDGSHLILSSIKKGSEASILVEPYPIGGASQTLFGLSEITFPTDPAPATIVGHSVKPPLDLSVRRMLRIAVDGGRPVDVDVAGAEPDRTFMNEIVAKINAVFPNLASGEFELRLTSPTVGADSSLALLPIRALELIDYPPVEVDEPPLAVKPGDRVAVQNDGAAGTQLQFEITAPQGESGMEFVDRAAGARVRVMTVLEAGKSIRIEPNSDGGLQAEITAPDGSFRLVPDSEILVGTLGAEAFVPFVGEWPLAHGAGADLPALLQLNDPSAPAVVVLRAHQEISPDDRIVVKVGKAKSSEHLFDVTLRLDSTDRPSKSETYSGVTIGRGPAADSLAVRIMTEPSQFVRADELEKAAILNLSRGRSTFTYMDCLAARFDQVKFPAESASGDSSLSRADDARFAGGTCREWAVFDISRFSDLPREDEAAYFGPPFPAPSVQASIHWTRYQTGAFVVNLPADLDEEFGARFDEGRFGLPDQKPEQYNGIITEPSTDRDYIVKRINARSTLVSASPFDRPAPPLGWDALTIPFMDPRSRKLTGGSETEPARMYLAENGVPGFIELQARAKGAWGNTIAVTAKQAGPVRFDMTIGYEGVRFENARQIALAGRILGPHENPLPELIAQILKPRPVGVLQAKAAGVRVDVTRDRTEAQLADPDFISPKPGPLARYLEFNGIDNYVEVEDSDAFSVGTTGSLTISMWMKPDAVDFPNFDGTGYVHWLGKGEGSGKNGQQEWAFRMYNLNNRESPPRPNRISFYLFNLTGGEGVGSHFQDPVHPGGWIHVVGAADTQRTYIYKNGVLRKCDEYRGGGSAGCERHPLIVTPKHGLAPLRMGHVNGKSFFQGGLAEVRIWNRALNRREVAALYALNKIPRNGLVAEYLLNEGRGDVAHDSVGNHNGTIFGADWEYPRRLSNPARRLVQPGISKINSQT